MTIGVLDRFLGGWAREEGCIYLKKKNLEQGRVLPKFSQKSDEEDGGALTLGWMQPPYLSSVTPGFNAYDYDLKYLCFIVSQS